MNLAKTKVLIFHTSSRVRSKGHLVLSHKPVEVVGSYVYMGVTFSACSSKFSMTQETKDRLTRGCASLSLLERQCHQVYFKEPLALRPISDPFPHVCISSMGSRSTIFHVDVIRETFGDDVISPTLKQIDSTT